MLQIRLNKEANHEDTQIGLKCNELIVMVVQKALRILSADLLTCDLS